MDLLDFLKSLIRSAFDGLRRNRIPAALSVIALVLSTALAFTGEFDERPRFRKMAQPEITKAEQQFFSVMDEAERETDEIRRLHYFLEGHRRAKATLRIIRDVRPVTAAGRRAHRELVRYYELIDEQLAIIRTEMSFRESFDYIGEWKRRNADLLLVRDRWESWIHPPA